MDMALSDLVHRAQPAHGDALQAPLERLGVGHGGADHVGVDGAGMDGVAADPVTRVLARRHLREDPHRALARGVRRLLVQRLPDASHRRDVHDRPAPHASHGGDGVLGAEKHPARVHRHHAVPLLHGALGDRHAGNDDARVVDQDVELAVAIDGELHGVAPVRLVRHVEVHVHGVAGVATNLGLDLLALVVAHVTEHDPGALAHECARLC
jgi:hypothetical protein